MSGPRIRLPWIALSLVPVILALFSVPAGAQVPSLVVTSPTPGAVVAGEVLFQGTAEDADSDLEWVEIEIVGAKGPPLKTRIPGNRANASWDLLWGSQSQADGRWAVRAVARDKAGTASEPVEFDLIVDNYPEPAVTALQVFFDEAGDGNYTEWTALETMPTTRLSFELRMSETMEEASLLSAMEFLGGGADWTLTPQGGSLYWVNVSYLEADTAYNFTVTSDAVDTAGNSLSENYSFAFRTTAEPTPGTPESGGIDLDALNSPYLWAGVGAAGVVAVALVAYREGLFRRLRERVVSRRPRDRSSPDEDRDDDL